MGTIVARVLDNDEMDRVMKLRRTYTFEIIYSHTKWYTGKWIKIEGSERPTR